MQCLDRRWQEMMLNFWVLGGSGTGTIGEKCLHVGSSKTVCWYKAGFLAQAILAQAVSGSVHPVFVTHVHTGSAAKHTIEVTVAVKNLSHRAIDTFVSHNIHLLVGNTRTAFCKLSVFPQHRAVVEATHPKNAPFAYLEAGQFKNSLVTTGLKKIPKGNKN